MVENKIYLSFEATHLDSNKTALTATYMKIYTLTFFTNIKNLLKTNWNANLRQDMHTKIV